MQHAHTTALAKVAFNRIPRVCGTNPFPHEWLYFVRERPHALRGEHGGYTESASGLFPAFGAVADVDCARFGEGGGEGDGAALAGDFGVAIFVFGFDFCRCGRCAGGGLVSSLS